MPDEELTPEEIQRTYDDVYRKLAAGIPNPSLIELRFMLQIIIKTLLITKGIDTQKVLEFVTIDMNSAWEELKEKQSMEGMKES